MKAIVKLKPGDGFVELVEKQEPVPGAGQVKIKVEAAGICGTDLKIRAGEAWSNPPVTLCHEFSGTVVESGEGVTNVRPGDRVVSETAQVVCRQCEYCMTGRQLMCPSRLSIGYGVDGAFAEFIVVRQEILHQIPEEISFDEAALCEPLAVAVHAVYDSVALGPTDCVGVIGPGAIGLLVAQVARAFGCRVVCMGINSDVERLRLARDLGIDDTLNSQKQNVEVEIRRITAEKGLDYVFDCSGAASGIATGLSLLKRNGTLVQIGLTKPLVEIPYALLPQKELTVKGTFGHNWRAWETGLQLMRTGKVRVKPMISHVFPIAQWEEAFRLAEERQGVKILIHPND